MAFGLTLGAGAAPAWAGSTELVSVGRGGGSNPSISADGRFVSFIRERTPGWGGDLLVRDRAAGRTQRIDVGNGAATDAVISADGRFVLFDSDATDLVAHDTNGREDVFIHDRREGTTERVSLSSKSVQGDQDSYAVDLSVGGRFALFSSQADNLAAGDTNGRSDAFLRDRQKGTTERVSVGQHVSGFGSTGWESYADSVSADGRFAAFTSRPLDGPPEFTFVFVRDRVAGTTELVSGGDTGSISAGGRFVAYEAFDARVGERVFVRDRLKGRTEQVSIGSQGQKAKGPSTTFPRSISADGRYVIFWSEATNLVRGDTNDLGDLFVRDRLKGTTERANVGPHGRQANGSSGGTNATLSADGRFAAFDSYASNLVPGGTDGKKDNVFVHDLSPAAP